MACWWDDNQRNEDTRYEELKDTGGDLARHWRKTLVFLC